MRRYQTDKKFKKVTTTPHLWNSYDDSRLSYSIPDTISSLGEYYYKIISKNRDSTQSVIGEYTIHNNLENTENLKVLNQNNYISVKLSYKEGTPTSVYIYNAADKSLIKKTDLVFKKKLEQMPFYVKPLRERGITCIEVKISDHKRKSSTSQLYEL